MRYKTPDRGEPVGREELEVSATEISAGASSPDGCGATPGRAPRSSRPGSSRGSRFFGTSVVGWRPCWLGDRRVRNRTSGAPHSGGQDGKTSCNTGTCNGSFGGSCAARSEEKAADLIRPTDREEDGFSKKEEEFSARIPEEDPPPKKKEFQAVRSLRISDLFGQGFRSYSDTDFGNQFGQ